MTTHWSTWSGHRRSRRRAATRNTFPGPDSHKHCSACWPRLGSGIPAMPPSLQPSYILCSDLHFTSLTPQCLFKGLWQSVATRTVHVTIWRVTWIPILMIREKQRNKTSLMSRCTRQITANDYCDLKCRPWVNEISFHDHCCSFPPAPLHSLAAGCIFINVTMYMPLSDDVFLHFSASHPRHELYTQHTMNSFFLNNNNIILFSQIHFNIVRTRDGFISF